MTAAFVIAVALSIQQAPPPPPVEATPAWTDDRPLTRIFQNLQRDLTKFPRITTIGIIGAGALGAAASHRADHDIADWVRDSGGERAYTPIGGLLGNAWLQGGAAIAAYSIGVVQDSP